MSVSVDQGWEGDHAVRVEGLICGMVPGVYRRDESVLAEDVDGFAIEYCVLDK
ncbi:hypothetical protein BMS3Bbin04_01186 [bacterium BMS3Bbin04]|nr:hypothetical protein BMS3Bbin04_01186 [bacterium BMS3Bbin04]